MNFINSFGVPPFRRSVLPRHEVDPMWIASVMECYPMLFGSHTFGWRTIYSSSLFSLDSLSRELFVSRVRVCARARAELSWRAIYRWQWHSSDFQPRPSALEIIYFVPEIMLYYNSRTAHRELCEQRAVVHTRAYSFAFAIISSHQVLCSCCYCP